METDCYQDFLSSFKKERKTRDEAEPIKGRGNLSEKDVCLSWGAKDTEYSSGSEIETDGDRHEHRNGDKCKGLVKQ